MNPSKAYAYLDLLAEMGIKAGIEHTMAISGLLGDPHESYPSILVAGTNGKGSVCAMLASILRRSGHRTGLYTSPHLVDVRERIRVDDEMITPDELAAGLTEIRRVSEEAAERGEIDSSPTFFEALTLLSFLHFKKEKVSIAVNEVGLGGRWDCTNIVRPCLSVVTSISLDHEEWLGKGIRNIAREKAGIFRAGVPSLTSANRPEALEVLRSEAARTGVTLAEPGECSKYCGPSTWGLACPEGELEGLPYPPLPGEHQLENAIAACRAALMLRKQGWRVEDGAIREGISSTRWPGRLQRCGGIPTVYLDGAHNLDGCRVLSDFASKLERPRVLVFAAMRDKPIDAMASALFPAFDRVLVTELEMDRCAKAEEIRSLGASQGVEIVRTPSKAVELAKELATSDGTVVVAGSLYLVGHILGGMGGLAVGEQLP